jgi:hypothetical protein
MTAADPIDIAMAVFCATCIVVIIAAAVAAFMLW